MSFEPASIRTLQKLRTGNKLDDDSEEEKENEGQAKEAEPAEAKQEVGPELE